jgi:hypothetical protein
LLNLSQHPIQTHAKMWQVNGQRHARLWQVKGLETAWIGMELLN